MTLTSGTRVGHYKILSPIAAGGMGRVYLAKDTRLERKIAIKFLGDEFKLSDDRLHRFTQEAMAASALNHPNIITIHEIGQAPDGARFIVTEFIEGETLRSRIRRERLDLRQVLEIAIQVSDALGAAHAAGIVHRDIKPENIMLRADGLAKVLDFGLAKLSEYKLLSTDSSVDTIVRIDTSPGIIVGTVQYMSPEQARGLPVDARSDVFGVGVVVYEMTAGRRPFGGKTNSDVIAAILTAEPPSLAEKVPEVPAELQRIVTKALRKDREERYQTCRDLLIDLKGLRKELEFAASQRGNAGETKTHLAGQLKGFRNSAATAWRFGLGHSLTILPLAALVIAAIWWLVAGRGNQAETPAPSSLKTAEILTWKSAPGEFYTTGSFSPDGKMVAFVSTKSGAKNIWVKQTTSGEAIQITKDEFANDSPIWSPNGDEIAFYSMRGNQVGIWRIPALGGTPTLIKGNFVLDKPTWL